MLASGSLVSDSTKTRVFPEVSREESDSFSCRGIHRIGTIDLEG